MCDIATFDNFGQVSYFRLLDAEDVVVNIITDENKLLLFKNMCINILTTGSEFNKISMHNLLFHLTNTNPKLINETIIEIYNYTTNGIHGKIQELVNNHTFTIFKFMELYNEFHWNSVKLSKYLAYFDNSIVRDSSHSYLGLIKNYTFYKNVIDTKYIDNNEYHLYEIFSKLIESEDISIADIIKLFKMYSFYIRLRYAAKSNKEQLFNQEADKLFLATLGGNNEFIKKIVTYIHEHIKNSSDDIAIINNISELINLISTHVYEKDMFNLYYEKYFEMRATSQNFNETIERKLISKFKKPTDNKIIQNMLYKLEDIQTCKKDKENYSKLKITIKSDKYKDKISVDRLKMTIFTPTIFRFYAWSHTQNTDHDEYTVPFELSPYIDIHTAYYKAAHPYKNLAWDFGLGTGIIKINLGGKIYQLQLTTPQLFLLLQFNHRSEIPATELASLMGISMTKLAPILNSLLISHILKREDNKPANDPSMLIYLNKNFKYDSEKISLINLMNSKQQQKQMDKEVNDKFCIGREQVLQAKIVKEMKINKHMTHTDLFNISKSLPFQIDESKFNSIIELCIKDGYMKKNQDKSYDYIEDSTDN
jgi:hypothetical protein